MFKTFLKTILTIVLTASFGVTHAAIVTIDFNGIGSGPGGDEANFSRTVNGFTISALGVNSTAYNCHDCARINNTGAAYLELVQDNNQAFDLISFDYTDQGLVTALGKQDIALPHIVPNWDTVLTPTFTNVTSVRFNAVSGHNFYLDNIVVNTNASVAAVPEPETYAMFLAGLGLLGFAQRKKQA